MGSCGDFFGNESQNVLGVAESIKFAKTEFKLALSGVPENGMYMHIYLPEGEDVVNYNEKLSLMVIQTDTTASQIVRKKIAANGTRYPFHLNHKRTFVRSFRILNLTHLIFVLIQRAE